MKKLLLSLVFIASSVTLSAQIILSGVSPASVQGNYEFAWADPGGGDWSCPDFNIPGTFIQGELMVVDDGSTGTNPQGNPISAEGCNPLVNDLTGKIAVIFRNTCEFGTKALNAQNAGAIGAIIVNREEEIIQMGGGANGLSVTIPVGFIKLSDGLNLINAMGDDPVEMFFGNRAGIYDNDLGLRLDRILVPKKSSQAALLASAAGEYEFEVGAGVFNLGNTDQNDITLNATITDPNGNEVYNETSGSFALVAINGNSIDSLNVLPGEATSLPSFSPMSWEEGKYTLTYTVTNDTVTDDFEDDNIQSFDFFIDSNLIAYVPVVEASMLPEGRDFYRPSSNPSLFSACVAFRDTNADRLAMEGVSFSASNTDFALTDELFNVTAFRWLDEFTDLNDPNVAFNGLVPSATVAYQYEDDLQRETVYAEFDQPLYLNSNERYLVCVQTNNQSVFLGHNISREYGYNQGTYLQPIQVTESDGQYFAVGFGADVIPAIGIHVRDTTGLVVEDDPGDDPGDDNPPAGIADSEFGGVKFFPNPTSGALVIEAGNGFANNMDVTVTDLAGRVVYQQNNAIAEGDLRLTLDLGDLNQGMYFVSLMNEDGQRLVKQVMKH
jgi:hypothetical protein